MSGFTLNQCRALFDSLKSARTIVAGQGHNTSDCLVGAPPIGTDGTVSYVRIADAGGAYDYHPRADGLIVRNCHGAPSRALESIALETSKTVSHI